jgi:hypothetical protein
MSLCDLTLGDSAPTLDALRWCSAFKRISFDIRSTRRTGIARYGYGSIYVVKMNRDRSDRIQKRLGGRIEVKIIRFRVPRLARWRPVRRHADPRFRRLPTWRDLHRRRGRVGHAGLQHQLRLLPQRGSVGKFRARAHRPEFRFVSDLHQNHGAATTILHFVANAGQRPRLADGGAI